MPKVSVIVPTYCSGEGLDRVIASLDAQTMPAADFETVFIDDGSPDDTFARLEKLAAQRPNMKVAQIPNSGWPSRPRNVGLDLAEGEFVVFMDHDDELFPDALADAYRFAVEHRADVVNTKECVTHGWSWGFSHYQRDVAPQQVTDPESLMPMRPHKLYRLDLLNTAGIRFREGRRVIYEDVFFNLEVLAHARRVAVLSSRPFYRWVNTGENNSSTYGKDPDEAWETFAEIFELIATLDLDPAARDFMVLHTYRLRVLTMMLGPRLASSDADWQRRTLEIAPAFVARHVPRRFDDLLNPMTAPRARLLRSGRDDLLPTLAEADRRVTAVLHADHVSWSTDGSLEIAGEAVWHDADGAPWPVRRDGVRLIRVLPQALDGAVPDDFVDLTDETGRAEAAFTVKGKDDSTDWTLPTTHEVHVDEAGARTVVRMRAKTVTPLDHGVFGRPLPQGHWNVGCRLAFAGNVTHSGVSYAGPARPALIGGRVLVAAATKRGKLAIEVDAPARLLLKQTRLAAGRSVIHRLNLRGRELRVPVLGVAVTGVGRVPLEVRLRPLGGGVDVVVRAAVVSDDEAAALVVPLPRSLGRGRFRLLVATPAANERQTTLWWTPVVVGRGRLGRASVERRPVRGGRKKVWGAKPAPGGRGGRRPRPGAGQA